MMAISDIMLRFALVLKKILYIAFLFLSVVTFGQKADSTKKGIGLIIKTDVLQPFYGGYEGGYGSLQNNSKFGDDYYILHSYALAVEKLLKKRHSIQVTFIETWLHYNCP